ncbi:Uncharacterised protein [Salmonella enterica subsp. enterica]|uniref:Uncharacterized protein n=1 Tax=Salmonella enterica I TaxID=59201 RepID=A0A379VVN0_SALET|nr:Uncharacterised protein [Salmonella enterica subsp. enterica]
MAEIDHDLRRQSRFGEAFFHLSNMLRAIVWRFTARRMIWQSPLPLVFTIAE